MATEQLHNLSASLSETVRVMPDYIYVVMLSPVADLYPIVIRYYNNMSLSSYDDPTAVGFGPKGRPRKSAL